VLGWVVTESGRREPDAAPPGPLALRAGALDLALVAVAAMPALALLG
jgi:hypothetical protein